MAEPMAAETNTIISGAPTNLRLAGPPGSRDVLGGVGNPAAPALTSELVHLNPRQTSSTAPVAPRAAPLPILTEPEELAVIGLVSHGADEAIAFVRQRAAALAGDTVTGTAGVRRRSLAKAAAIVEAQLSQLHALLATAIAKRDVGAVPLLDRAATGATKRFAILMDALRADEQRGLRPVVVVGAAGNVNVVGGA